MSFLHELLSTAEETNIHTMQKKLPFISNKIVQCKEEINNYLQNVYYKFREWPSKNEELITATTNLSLEIQDLQQRIEEIAIKDIPSETNKLDNLSLELERANTELHIIMRYVQINECFFDVIELMAKKNYLKAGHGLLKVDELVRGIPNDEMTDAVVSLLQNIDSEKHAIKQKLINMYEENVRMISVKTGAVQLNTIKIRNKPTELENLLLILSWLDSNCLHLEQFSKFVFELICKPIIMSLATVKVEEENGFHVITLAIKKITTKVPYKEVFSKLVEVFSFLHERFNFQFQESTTIAFIGNKIKYDLSETVLKDCLGDTVPSTDEDSSSYKKVIQDVKSFQSQLSDLGILDKESNPILEYANDMGTVFNKKKCEYYWSKAITYMKKDLHDLVDVGVPQDAGNLLAIDEFPESSISRSTIDLLELAQKLLQAALKDDDSAALLMICTVQSIFYQYGSIVYGHHERLLLTIPQQVALFRNNCMYIAHQLAQLNIVYNKKFSKTVLPSPPLFSDQAHQLQTMGGEIFLAYVEEQIQLIEVTLNDHQFTPAQLSRELHLDTDKCLRQCVRQHELLKTVWFKVLPNSVYNKTLGYLFSHFCQKLIDVVVSAEDIQLKNAEQLVEMYKIVLARGPKLFDEQHEIALYVQCWQKLNDLVFVLGANLADIKRGWSQGKGPLASSFKAEDMKSLIKALFQNTDRRAAVLSEI